MVSPGIELEPERFARESEADTADFLVLELHLKVAQW
jgi:hypothetical protein